MHEKDKKSKKKKKQRRYTRIQSGLSMVVGMARYRRMYLYCIRWWRSWWAEDDGDGFDRGCFRPCICMLSVHWAHGYRRKGRQSSQNIQKPILMLFSRCGCCCCQWNNSDSKRKNIGYDRDRARARWKCICWIYNVVVFRLLLRLSVDVLRP